MKTQLDMRTIAVAKIIPNQNNPRSEIGDVSDLEASIKAHGLISPLTVRWNGTRFEVVAGSRRLKALQNLGIDKVACNVIDGPEDKLFEIATAENVSRKNMSAGDECRAVLQMVKNGTDIRSIATNFGHSVRWALGRQKMAELGDEILKMLDEGTITLAHAEVLTMCDNDEDIMRFAENAAVESPEELKDMIMAEKSNLSKAPFNVAKICKNCEKQTITQQDIFGDVTDSYCRDGKCYQKHVQELIEAKKKECEDLGMIFVIGTKHAWSFNYCQKSEWINVNDEYSEKDEETIKQLKAAGKHPYYNIDDKAVVTAAWCKAEAKNSNDDDDTEAEDEKRHTDWERERHIREVICQKELAIVRSKVNEILFGISEESAALLVAALTRNTFNYIESDADGEEEEVEDSPLNHIDERYTDYQHEEGITWGTLLMEEVADGLMEYNGVSEEHREYFGIDHEKIVAEATKEIEEEQE